eukprot:PhF_6_TR17388/c0_g1_i1/m.26622
MKYKEYVISGVGKTEKYVQSIVTNLTNNITVLIRPKLEDRRKEETNKNKSKKPKIGKITLKRTPTAKATQRMIAVAESVKRKFRGAGKPKALLRERVLLDAKTTSLKIWMKKKSKKEKK